MNSGYSPLLNRDDKNRFFQGFNAFLNIECWLLRFFVILFFLGALIPLVILALAKTKTTYIVYGTVVSDGILTGILTVSYNDPRTNEKKISSFQSSRNYTPYIGKDIRLYVNKRNTNDVSDLAPFTPGVKIIFVSVLAVMTFLLGLLVYYTFKNADFCKMLSLVSVFNGGLFSGPAPAPVTGPNFTNMGQFMEF
jgi:hypothetical protein